VALFAGTNRHQWKNWAKRIETSDEWIFQEHRHSPPPCRWTHEKTSDLAIAAARTALADGKRDASSMMSLSLRPQRRIIPFRRQLCAYKRHLASVREFALDVQEWCSGLSTRWRLPIILSVWGQANRALVIGAGNFFSASRLE